MSITTNFKTIELLEGFNNYFNRIIKKYNSVDDYEDIQYYAHKDYFSIENINFNPNDNVSTKLIVNIDATKYDYLLVINPDDEAIESRWFILNCVRLRNGQYELSLKKDNIADNLESLLTSPMFVQKAMLSNTDPFIFNDEGMSFNQKKTDEHLLKDGSNTAWIVGYIAKNASPSDVSIQVPDEDFVAVTLTDIADEMSISESDLASILNFGENSNPSYFTRQIEFRFGTKTIFTAIGNPLLRKNSVIMNSTLTSGEWYTVFAYAWNKPIWTNVPQPNQAAEEVKNALIAYKAQVLNQLPTILNRKYFNENQYNILSSYENKIVLYNGTYYKITVNVANSAEQEVAGPMAYTSYSSLTNVINEANSHITVLSGGGLQTDGEISVRPTSLKVYVQMEEVSVESGVIAGVTTKISSSRKALNSQPFDMFAIPYGETTFNSDLGERKSIGEYSLSVASKIALELNANCYDVQLLPYCPFLDKYNNGVIDLTDLTEDVDFNYIDKTSSIVRVTETHDLQIQQDPEAQTGYSGDYFIIVDMPSSDITQIGYTINYGEEYTSARSITKVSLGSTTEIIFECDIQDGTVTQGMVSISIWYEYNGTDHKSFIIYCDKNSFSTTINYALTLTDSVKVDALCDKYRLVSPNYQGSFEFCVAKNGGKVDFFLAEATYRPYNPYIKVAPDFNLLYGANFGDCRGLICGGDFSIGIMTSAWETYQLNNKNYQNIFNREIQSLDLQQHIQSRNQLIGGISNIFGDTTKGAVTGGIMTGSPYGAIAGAVVGASVSSMGAAIDYQTLMVEQKEQRSLAIDKYNYQLGNIKALPYTLTKVGAFDINSKIFPFLEYYTATEEEKEALERKIQYESMTVMRIDYLANFYHETGDKYYFKAELIRNEELSFSTEVFNSIYGELLKGVYI